MNLSRLLSEKQLSLANACIPALNRALQAVRPLEKGQSDAPMMFAFCRRQAQTHSFPGHMSPVLTVSDGVASSLDVHLELMQKLRLMIKALDHDLDSPSSFRCRDLQQGFLGGAIRDPGKFFLCATAGLSEYGGEMVSSLVLHYLSQLHLTEMRAIAEFSDNEMFKQWLDHYGAQSL